MKISETIRILNEIKDKFGDISITGGHMMDEQPLREIIVTDTEGGEIWPHNVNNVEKFVIDGVFFTS